MAQAYRCDRCKTFFVKDVEYYQKEHDDYEERLRLYRDNRNSLVRNFDLCPDCQEELQNWFYNIDKSNENEQENEKKALRWRFLLSKKRREQSNAEKL